MTLIRHAKGGLVLALSLLGSLLSSTHAEGGIIISEVAYQGSGDDVCNGKDWIEIANTNGNDYDLEGYVLHDDKGALDEEAKTFEAATVLPSQGYLLVCRGTDFGFGVGGSDTITLLDADGQIVDSVSLSGDGPSDGSTLALIDGEFKYTNKATPGEANILEEPVPLEELLAEAYEAGAGFFGRENADDDMSDSSMEDLYDEFGDVIDINLEIDAESLSIIQDHPAWEQYVPFGGLSVSKASGADQGFVADDVVASSGGGRIRVKGQSTNTITACVGSPNVPFNIEFQAPFLGMEQMYLRNHFSDSSYMRDAMAHYMLKEVGLPYARTRPARLFMNGEYVGFYTLMEAPTQAHVLQRSLGVFDPEKTAIFKMKTAFNNCPMEGYEMFLPADDGSTPDTYYFERGSHKDDTPVLGLENILECVNVFAGEQAKDAADLAKGYAAYGYDCAETMIELGRVDRDYGPKSIEDPMKDFLHQYYDRENVDDLNDLVDTDQWLRNFAFDALVLHMDSASFLINNWYLATTNKGEGDWKIVQYDHNNYASAGIAGLVCGANCGPGVVYWPITRPTCGPIEDHDVVGRVMNSPENFDKYLSYVREYHGILSSTKVLGHIKAHGEMIKEYVVADPLNWYYQTVEDYATRELGEDTSDYNGMAEQVFYKFLRVRFEEVRKQLEAIDNGTLSAEADGDYDDRARCPDWRDTSGGFVPAGTVVGEDCLVPDCAVAAPCYDNNPMMCSAEGEIVMDGCKDASPFCDSCFPYSRCGGNLLVDKSPTMVESETCGPEMAAAGCLEAAQCFSHTSGFCDVEGNILTNECLLAIPFCEPCYPYSRCGSGELVEELVIPPPSSGEDNNKNENTSGILVESEACPPEMAAGGCATGAPCFDTSMGICQADGTFSIADCDIAAPCAPCFPDSPCGSGEDTGKPVDESGFLVESEACPPEMAAMGCLEGAVCFNHGMGLCLEDGTFADAGCDLAAPCAPCYPKSRCGTLEETAVEEEEVVEEKVEEPAVDEGEEPEPKPELEEELSESANSGATATGGILVAGWLVLLLCMVVA